MPPWPSLQPRGLRAATSASQTPVLALQGSETPRVAEGLQGRCSPLVSVIATVCPGWGRLIPAN